MRRRTPALVSVWAVLLIACGGIGLAREERLVADLGLVACDTQDRMAITDFRPGSGGHPASQTVFAVGWDEARIIAERHPCQDFRPDRTRTEYYIVVVRDRTGHGPFDEPEYRVRRDQLGVAEGLQFTRVYRELE